MRLIPFTEKQWGNFPPWKAAYELGRTPAGGFLPVNLPPLLKKFYGEQSKQLKFVALLREPLARMQSAWYHSQSFDFRNECVDCRAPDFETALRKHMSLALGSPPQYSDWLFTGFYAMQLEEWLEHFDAHQFYVIPTLYMEQGNKDKICKKISVDLDFAIDCDSHGAPMSHDWSHPHPKLEDDIPEDLRAEFGHMMQEREERLVEILTQAQVAGATLAEYNGKTGSQEDIAKWLKDGW